MKLGTMIRSGLVVHNFQDRSTLAQGDPLGRQNVRCLAEHDEIWHDNGHWSIAGLK